MTDYTIPTPDTDGKLPDDGIDSLAQQFRDALAVAARSARRQSAAREFYQPVVHEWAETLAGRLDGLSPDAVARFAAANRVTPGLRDAMLCAALADHTEEETLDMAADKDSKLTVSRIYRDLNGVFQDATRVPDLDKGLAAHNAFLRIAMSLPDGPHGSPGRDIANPFACAAYVAWYMDAPDISRGETAIAQRANPECNLAHIVDQAVAYGISPAWADARDASPAPDGATPSASGPAPGIGI